MPESKNSNSKKGYFHRYAHLIAFGAFLISIFSLYLSYQNVQHTSAPNVQLINITSYQADELDQGYRLHKSVSISGKLTIKNFGRSAVQLIKVDWEPFFPNMLFGISDTLDKPALHKYKERDPILGIKESIIQGGQIKKYNILSFVDTHDYEGYPSGFFRIQLTFSNGQQLTLIPEIKAHLTLSGF